VKRVHSSCGLVRPTVVLPASLPEIFVGLRTGLVLALITMVTSEMIARQAGVGNILFNAAAGYALTKSFAGKRAVVLLFLSSNALPRNLIEQDWFRTVAACA